MIPADAPDVVLRAVRDVLTEIGDESSMIDVGLHDGRFERCARVG